MNLIEETIVWSLKTTLNLVSFSAHTLVDAMLSPIIKRIRDEVGPVAQDAIRFKNWVQQEKQMIWDYRWEIGLSVVLFFVITWILFLSSIFLYGAFYRLVLTTPAQESITRPLYFNFPSPDKTFPPHIRLDFGDEVTLQQGYQLKFLASLPESPTNYEIGMFMVHTKLQYENSNKSVCNPRDIYQSGRPAILKWKTPLQRYLYTLFYAFPLVLGFETVEEKQHLEVVLFDEFIYDPPGTDYHLSVSIELSDPKVQIYKAELVLQAQLHGLSYLCYYYFYTCFFIGTTMNFFILFFSVLVLVSSFGILRYNNFLQFIPSRRQPHTELRQRDTEVMRQRTVPEEEKEQTREEEDEEQRVKKGKDIEREYMRDKTKGKEIEIEDPGNEN